MIQRVFKPQDIPLKDLEKIGLMKDGQFNLTGHDLEALMAGRRTGMLTLHNLSGDGVKIAAIDAKLSLALNPKGKAELLLHPVYKEAVYPEYLTDVEAEKLQNGTAVNIEKIITGKDGKKLDALIEYDPETKEFIITDTENILAPDLVNNEKLTPEQKLNFQKGKEVGISDGTFFQYTANDEQGVRSNRLAFIASIIVDGGLSYLLYAGLKALLHKDRDDVQAAYQSDDYKKALRDLTSEQNSRGFFERHEQTNEQRQVKR
jgi:hypothetical protein